MWPCLDLRRRSLRSSLISPVATVRAVVHEAGHETVADHLRWYPDDDGVRYVDPPNPLHCAADVECLPLADVLELGPETAGFCETDAVPGSGRAAG